MKKIEYSSAFLNDTFEQIFDIKENFLNPKLDV